MGVGEGEFSVAEVGFGHVQAVVHLLGAEPFFHPFQVDALAGAQSQHHHLIIAGGCREPFLVPESAPLGYAADV